jgi:hypothetical protein
VLTTNAKIVLNGTYLPTTINRFSITSHAKWHRGKHHKYPYCFRPWFWIHHKQCSPNSKVNCSVQRDAASLIAPDTIKANKLLQFASYEFDLSELYARKLQKEIYEQKGSFLMLALKVLYDQIQKKFIEEHAMASKQLIWALQRNLLRCIWSIKTDWKLSWFL